MASGFFKRTMVYLGLVDDEYEDYEDYEPTRAVARVAARAEDDEPQALAAAPAPVQSSSVRFRDESGTMSGGAVRLRPVPAEAAARVHVVAPHEFGDARQIADRLMGGQPVIVNLQSARGDLPRRMIDFCSGVTYSLQGKMERVADKVFLMTPSNVKVSAEERARLQENGLFQP
ncbi:MAG: cell division protein SepF [Acidimicrobiales bacterium]